MKQKSEIPNISYRAPSLEESGIQVLDLERFRERLNLYPFDPYCPHRVSYFCFIYIEQGSGKHQVDFNEYPYQSKSFIFINPNQVHAFDSQDCPQGKMVNITPEFFSTSSANIRTSYFAPVHQSLTASPVLALSKELDDSCQVFLDEVRKAQLEEADDDVVVQLLISALLIKLARQRESHLIHLSEQQKDRFDQFIDLVERRYFKEREVLQYAQWMHTSYKSLNLLCKSCSGRTAKQLIDFRVTLEIKRKLAMDGLSVQQTADDLGFDDITYFNKYFKRLNGLTPANFKRQSEGKG